MMLYYESPTNCRNVLTQLVAEVIGKPTNSKKNVIDVACAFDTENSSFLDVQGEKTAVNYIWMFGIEDTVVYGRHLDSFVQLINELNDYLKSEKKMIFVYIHNYKYDFQFIRTLFKWDIVFAKDRHEILYTRYGNIEFRDSIVLSGFQSLERIGKNLKNSENRKKVGDLNYDLLRLPETPLTLKELEYCEYDVRVLIDYIREKISEEGHITNIPYTNTGYVRRYVRNACFREREKYLRIIDNLTITAAAYQQCERAFMGGAVGPNIKFIGQTLNDIASYDIKSSYPYVMVTGYFPMSYGRPVPNIKAVDYLLSGSWCCIFDLEIYGLIPKQSFCYPISQSKCTKLTGAVTASGRVLTAQYLKISCTELDYATYTEFYDISFSNCRITNMRIYQKGKLPLPIVNSVFEFFNKKTVLDGVQGSEAEYMIAKNMLNSIYGMMVERPVRNEYIYESDIMNKIPPDYIEQIGRYNEKYDRFLFYPWGVYVTAHARRRLYSAIAEVGSDFVYCDTDSVKFRNELSHTKYFQDVNIQARKNIENIATDCNLDLDYLLPKAPSGEIKVLGVWEHEFTAKRFKTLGAKRYLVELDNGKHIFTVAGTNKDASLKYLETLPGDIFKNFNENLIIPKENAKRISARFIDDERRGHIEDYTGKRHYYYQATGIYMERTSYSFSITDETKLAFRVLTGKTKIDDGNYV